MTARVAAERVQSSKQPFRLNPMSSRERRIVHLALKDMPGVRTESVGVGEERQVVIHPADSKACALGIALEHSLAGTYGSPCPSATETESTESKV